MPVETCQKDGKPGFRASPDSTCYTYTPGDETSRKRAQARAQRQLRAIKASQNK